MARETGILEDWHDARGFGFIRRPGGAKIYVHMKSIGKSTERPKPGDILHLRSRRRRQRPAGRDQCPEQRAAAPAQVRRQTGAEGPTRHAHGYTRGVTAPRTAARRAWHAQHFDARRRRRGHHRSARQQHHARAASPLGWPALSDRGDRLVAVLSGRQARRRKAAMARAGTPPPPARPHLRHRRRTARPARPAPQDLQARLRDDHSADHRAPRAHAWPDHVRRLCARAGSATSSAAPSTG